jgi:ProP effector
MTEPAAKTPRRNPLLERLYKEFPVFRDHLPLAIGIHKTLVERIPGLAKGQVWSAMQHHTGSTRYLKALVENAPRFDIDGNPAGAVTAEQQAQAAKTLRERLKKAAERRKAELEEQKLEQQRQQKLQQLADKFNPR